MLQSVFTYLLLAAAVSYVCYRFYVQLKKKQACDKCALMREAKKIK